MNAILALDIGTEFVKAIIAKPSKEDNLEILGIGKSKHSDGSIRAGAISNIPAVVSSCEKALAEAEKSAGIKANSVAIGIAGELVKGNTTSVHYQRKNPNKPITEAEMDDIVKKVQQKSGDVARETIKLETGNKNIEVSLINSAIVSLIIDGHKVSNPIGFKGSDVSIIFYTAFAPITYISAVEKVCAELNLDLLTIVIEPFAIGRAYLGENNKLSSLILLDIGSEMTNLVVIEDNGIVGTKMLPIGSKNISDKDDIATWLTGLEVILGSFDDLESLPYNILLSGDGSELSIIQEQLAISNWYADLPFSRRPNIDLIEPNTLPNFIFGEYSLDNSFVTALGLLRVGLDTLVDTPKEGRIRAKIKKLLQN